MNLIKFTTLKKGMRVNGSLERRNIEKDVPHERADTGLVGFHRKFREESTIKEALSSGLIERFRRTEGKQV